LASKKSYEIQMLFNRVKKSAAQEFQSPAPPLKKKDIFSPSFRKDGHNHSEVKFICRVSRKLFSADCLMFNLCHTKV